MEPGIGLQGTLRKVLGIRLEDIGEESRRPERRLSHF